MQRCWWLPRSVLLICCVAPKVRTPDGSGRRREGVGLTFAESRNSESVQHFDSIDLRQWIPRMKARKAHGQSLEKLAEEHRVVVVMTTIPLRMERLEPVLDSMLAQTWPIQALYLSIPYRYNRTGELYRIPGWLRAKNGVRVLRCEDLGPGTHMLNGLRIERDPWTFMVIVDDDHIYAPDLVETLMRSALAYPGSAVAAQGFLSVPGLEISRDSPRYLHDQGFAGGPVLVSYLGVVYQRGFFDDSIFDYSDTSRQCVYQDDMWFSAHLARKGIKRLVLGAALGVHELKDLHLGPSSLTFWEENKPRNVNLDCNAGLLKKDPDLWALRRRFVLVVAGLPQIPTSVFVPDLSTGSSHREWLAGFGERLAASDGWGGVVIALQRLHVGPDVAYLCTESGAKLDEHAFPGHAFNFGGILVTLSDACNARVPELPVGKALRDPLRWEADSDTIVVLGTLNDLVAKQAAISTVAHCAVAKQSFDAEASTPGDLEAVPLRISGIEAERWHGDSEGSSQSMDDGSPFCRQEGLVAVSIGGFERAFGPSSVR